MGETIKIQPVDGTWQTLGEGVLPAAVRQGISAEWDTHGPIRVSFDMLGVDTRLPARELAEFTPLEIYGPDGQEPVWGGRILETPGRDDGGLGVLAEGWQRHRHDDGHPLFYIYEGLTDFVDYRSFGPGTLAALSATVTVGPRRIRVGWPQNAVLTAGQYAGVTLDLGPGNEARKIAAVLSTSFNASSIVVYLIGHSAPDWLEPGGSNRDDYASAIALNDAATFVAANTKRLLVRSIPDAHRYFTLLLYDSSHAGAVGECWVDMHHFAAFALDAYGVATGTSTPTEHPPPVSALTADVAIKDQLAKCPLLSTDYSRITPVTFKPRAMGGAGEGDAKPGDVIERFNSYHRFREGVDASKRGYFMAQPAVPELVVNTADDGVEYEDASVNSGQAIYNKVVVVGRSGAGDELREVVYSSQGLNRHAVTQHQNPGAEIVSPLGWTSVGGAPTRTTTAGEFFSGAAAFNVPTNVTMWSADLAGPWLKGMRYRLRMMMRIPAASVPVIAGSTLLVRIGFVTSNAVAAPISTTSIRTPANNSVYFEVTNDYILPSDFAVRAIYVENLTTGAVQVDDIVISRAMGTEPDKRGFMRSAELQCQAPTDPVTMRLLGDLFLAAHSRAPFKGSLTVTGAVIRDRSNGRQLTPIEAASRAGELVELADVIDPYTAATGRVAQVVTGTYTPDVANLALDEDRSRYEALMARTGALQTSR